VCKSRVERADLLVSPIPNIVKESPDYFFVTFDDVVLGPEISAAEARKVLEVPHYLIKVGLDL